MVMIEGFQNIPTELVIRIILHSFYKTGFNKTSVQIQKQKFLSKPLPTRNGLESGKLWSFVSNIHFDKPFLVKTMQVRL